MPTGLVSCAVLSSHRNGCGKSVVYSTALDSRPAASVVTESARFSSSLFSRACVAFRYTRADFAEQPPPSIGEREHHTTGLRAYRRRIVQRERISCARCLFDECVDIFAVERIQSVPNSEKKSRAIDIRECLCARVFRM